MDDEHSDSLQEAPSTEAALDLSVLQSLDFGPDFIPDLGPGQWGRDLMRDELFFGAGPGDAGMSNAATGNVACYTRLLSNSGRSKLGLATGLIDK